MNIFPKNVKLIPFKWIVDFLVRQSFLDWSKEKVRQIEDRYTVFYLIYMGYVCYFLFYENTNAYMIAVLIVNICQSRLQQRVHLPVIHEINYYWNTLNSSAEKIFIERAFSRSILYILSNSILDW